MKIAVVGAAGRMGRELVRAVHDSDGVTLMGAIEAKGSIAIGEDVGLLAGLGKIGVMVSDDVAGTFASVDGVLDFTVPAASVMFADMAAKARIVHVIGTTGCSAADDARIKTAGQSATIIKAGNMSLGVNLLVELTKKIAAALDEDFDCEVLEMHHRMKVDAPSGTALMLGEAAAAGRKISLDGKAVMSREGQTGARKRGDIGFATLRGGSVVGEHTVIFTSDSERIEITHRAFDRGLFAKGAVKAALWGHGKPPGLYTMADVLGM